MVSESQDAKLKLQKANEEMFGKSTEDRIPSAFRQNQKNSTDKNH